jgi:hypothetical protein
VRRRLQTLCKPKEIDRFVSGFFEVDAGVGRHIIRSQHKCLSGLLDAQLRAVKRETLALNRTPDLFMAGIVRVRLTHLHGEDCHGADASDCGQAIIFAEEAGFDVGPVSSRSLIGKG